MSLKRELSQKRNWLLESSHDIRLQASRVIHRSDNRRCIDANTKSNQSTKAHVLRKSSMHWIMVHSELLAWLRDAETQLIACTTMITID